MNTFRKLGVFALIAVIAVVTFGHIPADHKVSAQDTTLVIWHSWQDAEADLLDAWIDAYTEEMSDVAVETRFIPFDDLRSTYENNAGTPDGPDLLIGAADWAGGFHQDGFALALNDIVAGTDLESNLTEAAWDLMAFDGNRYGVPVTLDGVALYYNRDFIDDDEVPETFDDMLELAEELSEGDDVGLLFNNGFYHSAGIYFGLDGQLFDAEDNNLWNTDEAAVGFLEAHVDVFSANEAFYTGDNNLFREGRAAMIIDGVWNLGTYTDDLGDRLGVALLPDVGEDMPWRPFFGGKGFYVNNTTENVDAAVSFLTFVTSPDGLALGSELAGHVPPSDAVEVENEAIGVFAAQFAVGVPLPTSPTMGAYWEPLGNALTAVTEGGESPEDAAAAAEATILEKLNEEAEGE